MSWCEVGGARGTGAIIKEMFRNQPRGDLKTKESDNT